LQNVQKWLSSISLLVELMNLHSGMNDNNNRRTKATAAIPMAGAIVTAALLLSGLSLIVSFPQATAQENMTGGVGGGATSGTTDNATSTTGGASQGGNATTTAGGGANQSTSEVRMNIEQARMALQNNDTQGAMMYLDIALSALGGGAQGNMTNATTTGGMTNATTTGGMTNATTTGGMTNATTGGATTDGTTGGATTDGTTGGATTDGTTGGATTDGGDTSGGGGPLAGIFGG
jgi:hypothetical protein